MEVPLGLPPILLTCAGSGEWKAMLEEGLECATRPALALQSERYSVAQRVGVQERDYAKPNEIEDFAIISRNRSRARLPQNDPEANGVLVNLGLCNWWLF